MCMDAKGGVPGAAGSWSDPDPQGRRVLTRWPPRQMGPSLGAAGRGKKGPRGSTPARNQTASPQNKHNTHHSVKNSVPCTRVRSIWAVMSACRPSALPRSCGVPSAASSSPFPPSLPRPSSSSIRLDSLGTSAVMPASRSATGSTGSSSSSAPRLGTSAVIESAPDGPRGPVSSMSDIWPGLDTATTTGAVRSSSSHAAVGMLGMPALPPEPPLTSSS